MFNSGSCLECGSWVGSKSFDNKMVLKALRMIELH